MSLTEVMVLPMPCTAVTVLPVNCWISSTLAWMSSVALAVWLASAFTSDATTAKPLPCSPARAASMVAFSASRLVCPAMALISSTTCPISWAAEARLWIMPSIFAASSTARPATLVDMVT